jgi:PAS domain S-box-containing protein
VRLSFVRRDGPAFDVVIVPARVRLNEFFPDFLIPYLVGVALLGSGLWVHRMGQGKLPARAFLLFASAASITTGAFYDMNTTHHMLPGWTLSLGVAAGALAHLALLFPQRTAFIDRHPKARFVHWLAILPIAVYGAGEILFPSSPWGYIQAWLWGYISLVVAILLFFGMLWVRVFRSPYPIVRQQSRIILFGSILAFGPVLVLYLLPSVMGQSPVFQAAFYFTPLVILLLSIAYAIVRYRLLDVDRLLRDIVNYFLISVVALTGFYAILNGFSFILQESLNPTHPLVVASYLFLLVLALNPLRNMVQKAINRIFYRTPTDYSRALNILSRELATNLDLRHTTSLLVRVLRQILNPEHVLLFLCDDDRAVYLPYGEYQPPGVVLPAEDMFIRLLNRLSKPIWFPLQVTESSAEPLTDPAGESDSPSSPVEVSIPQRLGCPVFAPLHYENKLIGFLALGPRRSGSMYTRDDLDFLEAFAGQSSLALENVRLFANLQRTLAETREMKNLMDDIFASIASGVITVDLQRKITLFNQAAEAILGVPAEQVLGVSLSAAFPALAAHLDLLTSATIEGNARALGEELSPDLPGRGPLHLRLSATPLRDARLETVGATIVIDDLTEQRKLEAERERIHRTFGRVVAPRVRDRLLSDPTSLRLDGVRQTVTILFADIHGFTSLSEHMQPEALFELLNSYLSRFAQTILDEEGTLDKFMGDAVLSFWNAPDAQPDHTLRAARAALSIRHIIRAHLPSLSEANQLTFSIGITRGEAMIGNVGTSELFNYTAIGDIVNTAQRIESVAEPGQILLSEEAYHSIAEQVDAQRLPPVKLRGRQQEVVVYELKGLR